MMSIHPRAMPCVASLLFFVLMGVAWCEVSGSGEPMTLSPSLRVHQGKWGNQALVGAPGEVPVVSVYGAAGSLLEADLPVLLTHGRRDVLPENTGALWRVHGPHSERHWLSEPEAFWADWVSARFHDYSQQTSKVPLQPLPVREWVEDGDVMTFGSWRFRVLATPGFTRGSVSYLAEIDGRRTAFTGDLIYGDGQILDLYSFQDKIPGAQIRGYHGYGSRLAELLQSVRKIQKEKIDRIVPARGPVIENPQLALTKLVDRVQALYRNYLSINALHWYFKERRMVICGERVLGRGAPMELMPYAHHEAEPDWVFTQGTSRLLISEEGFGFLLDCGTEAVVETVEGLIKEGRLKGVEGIFVTHFHDDHADAVQLGAERLGCPVYALEAYEDVLERPEAYRLPAMTPNAIREVVGMKDGQEVKWREFGFTYHFYPGQTYYHGALFVKKPGERLHCFIGDSFSPSGIDDYCVQNRNLVHEDSGYLLCFEKLRRLKEPYWLINEHIPHVFRFSDEELTHLETRYRERIDLMRELFPWDDPNYGVDEQWAVFYPYGQTVAASQETASVSLRLSNHSPVAREFQLVFRGTEGLSVKPAQEKITVASRGLGEVKIEVGGLRDPGVHLITVDVESEGMAFREWAEALIIVEEE